MNLKLQTVQPEFLAKLLNDVDLFKNDVNYFVDEYTEKSVADTCRVTLDVGLRVYVLHLTRKHLLNNSKTFKLIQVIKVTSGLTDSEE